MSKIFAFNVAKPSEVSDAPPDGAYDAKLQVWRGQERSVAVNCTLAAFKKCQVTFSVCQEAGYPLPLGWRCDF